MGVDANDMGLFSEGDLLVIEANGYTVELNVVGFGYPGDENCFTPEGDLNTGYVYIDGDFNSISPIQSLMPEHWFTFKSMKMTM